MSLIPSLVRTLLQLNGDAAVIDTGMAPYVLAGDREIEVASEAVTFAEVDGLLGAYMPAESRRALDKHGATSCSLLPLPDFPDERFTLVALKTETNFWVEIRRDPSSVRPTEAAASAGTGAAISPVRLDAPPTQTAVAPSSNGVSAAPVAPVATGIPPVEALPVEAAKTASRIDATATPASARVVVEAAATQDASGPARKAIGLGTFDDFDELWAPVPSAPPPSFAPAPQDPHRLEQPALEIGDLDGLDDLDGLFRVTPAASAASSGESIAAAEASALHAVDVLGAEAPGGSEPIGSAPPDASALATPTPGIADFRDIDDFLPPFDAVSMPTSADAPGADVASGLFSAESVMTRDADGPARPPMEIGDLGDLGDLDDLDDLFPARGEATPASAVAPTTEVPRSLPPVESVTSREADNPARPALSIGGLAALDDLAALFAATPTASTPSSVEPVPAGDASVTLPLDALATDALVTEAPSAFEPIDASAPHDARDHERRTIDIGDLATLDDLFPARDGTPTPASAIAPPAEVPSSLSSVESVTSREAASPSRPALEIEDLEDLAAPFPATPVTSVPSSGEPIAAGEVSAPLVINALATDPGGVSESIDAPAPHDASGLERPVLKPGDLDDLDDRLPARDAASTPASAVAPIAGVPSHRSPAESVASREIDSPARPALKALDHDHRDGLNPLSASARVASPPAPAEAPITEASSGPAPVEVVASPATVRPAAVAPAARDASAVVPRSLELEDLEDIEDLFPPRDEEPPAARVLPFVEAPHAKREIPAATPRVGGDAVAADPGEEDTPGTAGSGFSTRLARLGRRASALAATFRRPFGRDRAHDDRSDDDRAEPPLPVAPLVISPPLQELSFAEGLSVDGESGIEPASMPVGAAFPTSSAAGAFFRSVAKDADDLAIPDASELWPGRSADRWAPPTPTSADESLAVDGLLGGDGVTAGSDQLMFEAAPAALEQGPSTPAEIVAPRFDVTKWSPALSKLVDEAVQRGAETLYLAKQSPPAIRVDGEILFLDREAPMTGSEVESLLMESMPDGLWQALKSGGRAEWVSEVPGVGRVLCLVFRDSRGMTANFRFAPQAASTEQLKLPAEVQALTLEREGLILLGGGRSGDRHVLATAFVDLINTVRHGYIITLERDIQIVHDPKESLVSQREVRGGDRELLISMNAALREDPDVLVIHDLRGDAAVRLALETAAAGHLVIAGLPVRTAPAAVEWVLDAYTPDLRPRALQALADHLQGVVTQVALRNHEGRMLFSREIMLRTPEFERLIASGQTTQLAAAIAAGHGSGSQSLDETLAELVHSGTVDMHQAYRRAGDRTALVTALRQRGIETSLIDPHG